jgi:hypothetical protein
MVRRLAAAATCHYENIRQLNRNSERIPRCLRRGASKEKQQEQ